MFVGSELSARILRRMMYRDPTLGSNQAEMARLNAGLARTPERYCIDDEDRAFCELGRAMDGIRREVDDRTDAYYDALDADPTGTQPIPDTGMPFSVTALNKCLELDQCCWDARLLLLLVGGADVETALAEIDRMLPEACEWCRERSDKYEPGMPDAWESMYMRPWLRLRSRKIDLLTRSCRFKAALRECTELLELSPTDAQGIRYTAALLYARLEDHDGLLGLDQRFGYDGNPWMHVARSLLFYKLGRMDAARRSAKGLASLYPALAYYMVNPGYVVPYLPDRPSCAPHSEAESSYAAWEADFLLVDTPEYVEWAMGIPTFRDAVQEFGRSKGEPSF